MKFNLNRRFATHVEAYVPRCHVMAYNTFESVPCQWNDYCCFSTSHRYAKLQKWRRSSLARSVNIMYGLKLRHGYNAMLQAVVEAKNIIIMASAKLRHVVHIMVHEKSTESFVEWRDLILKRKKAEAHCSRQRLKLAMNEWTGGLLEQFELFRAVAVKCSHFLALLTGQNVVDCFHRWKHRTQNKRKSVRLRQARQHAYLESVIAELRAYKDSRKLQRLLLQQVGTFFRRAMGGFFSEDKKSTCFRVWWEIVAKKKKAISIWRGKALSLAWQAWMEIMIDVWAIKDQVRKKCANVLALLTGDTCKAMLLAWKALVAKHKRAMKKWSSQSVQRAVNAWKYYKQQQARIRDLLKVSLASWDSSNMWWSFTTWASITDERLYFRAIMHDALRVWMNVCIIHAFRAMDENARIAIHHRRVVESFRRRFEMRPAQVCTLIWRDTAASKSYRRSMMHTCAFRYKNRCVLRAWNQMRDQVLDTKLIEAENRARDSDVLRRMHRYSYVLTLQKLSYMHVPYIVQT
jgi:hypothetical protein